MLDAFALAGTSIGVAALLSAGIIPGGTAAVLAVAWGVTFVSLVYLGIRLAMWSVANIAATPIRIILVSGLRKRKLTVIPLNQIWDMTFIRSTPARILGYGTFVLELAPEHGQHTINFLPYPEQLYLELVDLIFPANDEFDEPDG